MVKSDKCSTTNTLRDYWSPFDVSTTLFFQDACLKGKNIWHQHLPTKKLTAYLIASFHSITLYEKMPNGAIIDQNKHTQNS